MSAVQTAFENAYVNTRDKLPLDQQRYGLRIPSGHEGCSSLGVLPTTMENYCTGGTPWFVAIECISLCCCEASCPICKMAMSFPLGPASGRRRGARQIRRRSGVMVEDGGALARATSIGPRAATGISADAAGGIPRYGVTRRGGNNDRLSTLWREVISLAGVARSFSSGGLKQTGATMKIQVCSLAIALAIAVPIAVTATAKSSAAPINGRSIKAAVPAVTTDVRYQVRRGHPYSSYWGYPTYNSYWGYPNYNSYWGYPTYNSYSSYPTYYYRDFSYGWW